MLDAGIGSAMELTEAIEGMTAEQAVKLIRELCARLEQGAEAFHGNIWPGSVTIREDGQAVLGEGSDAPVSGRTAAQVEFVAPEFFWDGEGTPASDVYSLGLMLYSGCNDGYLPFQPKGGALTDKDRSGALRKRMKGEDIPLPAGVSGELGRVLKTALAYEPEDRYATPGALLEALGGTDEALPPPEEDDAWEADVTDGMEEPASIDLSPEEEAAAAVPEKAPARGAPQYTVQKNFEKNRGRKAASAAPASRTKKKKTSAVIPVLCVLAAAVVGGGVWYALNHQAPRTSPTLDIQESEPLVVLPAESPEATEAPMPEEIHTVALAELSEEEGGEEAAETDEAVSGSDMVDGMEVAAVSDTVYVTGSGVNLRSGPGTSYEVSTTLPRGVKLQRTGTVNGWSQVQYEGGEYYVSSALISTEDPTGGDTAETVEEGGSKTAPADAKTEEDGGTDAASAPAVTETNDTVTVTGAEVNLRTGPSTGSDIVTTVTQGTELKRAGTVNGWSLVTYQGKEVYISNSMISVGSAGSNAASNANASPASGSGTSDASGVTSGVGTLRVTSDVNVRAGADTSYDILGVAKAGETLSITGLADGKWYRVSYDGKEGYVNRKLVSVQDYAAVAERSGSVEVVSKANVRSGPGTSYDILGVADVGRTLTVTGYADSNWYQVTFDGKTGYVAGNLVK